MSLIGRARTKVADVVMPWAAANASVWPSQHEAHGALLGEIRDLEAQRAGAVEAIRAHRRAVYAAAGSEPRPSDVALWAAALGDEPPGGRVVSNIERQLRDEIAELGEQIDRDQEAYAALRADRDRVQLLADARADQLAGAVKALEEIAKLAKPRDGRTDEERVQALADIHFLATRGAVVTVIARSLTVYECPRCGLRKLDSGDMVIHSRDCGGTFEPVEYVPSTAAQGAVEALRWALGFIEYQGKPSPLDDPREGEADAESYRRALAILGGQS
jgi:hypothetical protein